MAAANGGRCVDSLKARPHHRACESALAGFPKADDRARSRSIAKTPSHHVQRRLCPSSRPFGLFAAEGLDQDRKARRTRQSRSPAGAGADRHRQHVRGAGVLRQDGRLRHPADHRLRARGRFRRPGPQCAECASHNAGADRAVGGARARLSQPDAAQLPRLPGDAGPPGPAHQVRVAEGRCRGFDRAHRRSRRADFARDRGQSFGAGAVALRQPGWPVRRPALYRAAAPRHRSGTPGRGPPDRSRLFQRAAAGCDQRALFRDV